MSEILFKNSIKVIRFQIIVVNIIENRIKNDLISIKTLNVIAEV
jgi:hypothetical protein